MGPQEEMVSDITNNNVSGLERPCSMDLAQAFLWAIRKKALGLLENNTVPIWEQVSFLCKEKLTFMQMHTWFFWPCEDLNQVL